MRPYTAHWIQSLDKATQDFARAFGKLTAEQLNWKPAPESWSVAQCIDHLIATNESYFPILDQLKEGSYKAPWHGQFPMITRFLGNLILQAVQPDRKKKTKTFPVWEPGQSALPADILRQFERHQEVLKKRILESEDLVERKAVISSPANRGIVYHLGMAFEILVVHEQRHFNQAWEIWSLQKGKP